MMKKAKLSKGERELRREVEAGEWKPVKLDAATLVRYQEAARQKLQEQ